MGKKKTKSEARRIEVQKKKRACRKGHEVQCTFANPENSNRCACPCVGDNHGKDNTR